MVQVAAGADLPEVYTNGLGFKTLAGEVKVQLPTIWTDGPPTSSSLLSIASSKGILAAAGPESLVIIATDRIRAAFKDAKSKDETVQLSPDLSIPTPRLSHVAFSSDNTGLIVTAESGGGLAVYPTEALLNKATMPAVEMATSGVAVKALAPNPDPNAANYIAVLLTNGHLMLANLKDKSFQSGPNGQTSIKDNVTSVAWSVRGKQLVAGLVDGTAVLLDPQGNVKATIPKPPGMGDGIQMSSIVWLANDEFLTIHGVTNPATDTAPEAVFHYLRTNKERTQFEFRKCPNEPCFAVISRMPASYFVSRIRKWSQLDDVILLTSAASSDVGLLSNSQTPLNAQSNPSDVNGVYGFTILENDARKAALPMSTHGMDDTFPIGQAIDYSSKDKVWQPIPGDDTIQGDSPHPLPALVVLNGEGMLSYWWFINDEGLRKNVPCPGLIALDAGTTSSPTPQSTSAPPSQSAFKSSSAFGAATSAFGAKPAQPAFGSPSLATPAKPAFGQPAFGQSSGPAFGKPAFGASPSLGTSNSPWGTTPAAKQITPAFGKPTFGTPAPMGFGQTAALGSSSASPWGTPAPNATTAVPTSAFGGDSTAGSGFAKFAQTQPASSFASMGANKTTGGAPVSSPFASMGAHKSSTPFGSALKQETSFSQTPQQSFGSTVTLSSAAGGSSVNGQSVFGSGTFGTPAKSSSVFSPSSSFKTEVPAKKNDQEMTDDTPAAQPAVATASNTSPFGLSTPFKIIPTFKPAESAKEKDEEPSNKTTSSGFGLGSLGAGLGSPVPEVKPDPDLPTKSIFDTPARSIETGDSSSTTQAPQQPEPPEVTSKPVPSSSSGTYSGQSSTIAKSIEVDKNQTSSPAASPTASPAASPGSIEDEVVVKQEELDGEENEIARTSREGSSEHGEKIATTPRDESLPASSPLSVSARTTALPTPEPVAASFSGSPAGPKPLFGLKGTGSIRSPLGESTGIPPPAPTPPVVSSFPSFKSSTTPAGLPQGPSFAPPKQKELPRSPSPVRRISKLVGKKAETTSVPQPISISRTGSGRPASEEERRPRVDVLSDLRDDLDDSIRETLSKPLEPTTEIEQFVAHTDYAGTVTLAGVSGNIESIYRDINSMIDSLGQNARALASFVAGHQEGSDANPDGTDLNDSTRNWTLDDVDRVKSMAHNLERTLLHDPIKSTNDLRSDIVDIKRRLRPAKEDHKKIKSFLQAYKNPTEQTKRRNAPLDPDAAAHQRAMLTQLAIFKKTLAEAEDTATIVKAKISARNGSRQAPTVEAVEKTIRKMTAMVQQRSMEVDHLEKQMRNLGLLAASRPGSTRNSPAKGRSFGLVLAADDVVDEAAEREEREWRVEHAVQVRKRRRAILGKIKQELDKRDLSELQKVPDGY